jgi:DNA transposition AAA+ family ATPase
MSSKPKRTTMTEQLRQAIADCGVTRSRIARETGVDEASLCNFMAGRRGFTLATLDRLGDFLQLEIVRRPARRKRR